MDKIFSINSTGMGSLQCYCKQTQLAQLVALFIKERKEYLALKNSQ